METKDPLDQILDGALKGHTISPSATSKSEHLDAMRQSIINANKRRNQKRLSLSLISAAAVIGALILFLTSDNWLVEKELSPTSQSEKATITDNSLNHPNTETAKSAVLNISEEKRSNNLNENHLISKDNDISKDQYEIKENSNQSSEEVKPIEDITQETHIPQINYTVLGNMKSQSFDLYSALAVAPIMNKRETHLNLLAGVRKEDTLNRPTPKGFFNNKTLKGLSIAGEYSPEYIFNGTDDADQWVHSGALTFEYKRKGYSIRTGVGLSITGDITRESIDFKSYLGTTKVLDSVQFEWDEDNRKLTPVFYYTDQRVFEDQISNAILKTKMRYTYLQIPLVLGYDFVNQRNYSIGVRAGSIFQILLKSEQISTDYSGGDNLIINMAQVTPDRVKLHWEALGGLNFGFRISNSVSLELEPQARYYFNSVYEKNDGINKPWSLSLRTALIYRLSR